MIDEQSSASEHDCASDRSAIGAGCNYMVNNITKQTIWIGFLLLGHVVFMCSHILNVGNSTAVLPMHPNYHKAWSEGFIRHGQEANCVMSDRTHSPGHDSYRETNNQR